MGKEEQRQQGQFYCQILSKTLPREITGDLSVDHRHAHLLAHLENMTDDELDRLIKAEQDRSRDRLDCSQ